jgi:hypothetical protein
MSGPGVDQHSGSDQGRENGRGRKGPGLAHEHGSLFSVSFVSLSLDGRMKRPAGNGFNASTRRAIHIMGLICNRSCAIKRFDKQANVKSFDSAGQLIAILFGRPIRGRADRS